MFQTIAGTDAQFEWRGGRDVITGLAIGRCGVYRFRLETSYWHWLPSETYPSMDIFNGIRMENRGGSEGRMAIARLDKVGLLYSPVCFAFKDVALLLVV